MSRPSESNMKSTAKKLNSTGVQFKTQKYGGPTASDDTSIESDYDNTFRKEHPTYPDYMFPDTSAEDRYMGTKNEITEQKNRKSEVTDRDIKYQMGKKDMVEAARFKKFVEDSIPRGTPWAKEFFEKIEPNWYKSKEQIINEKVEMLKRYFKIVLHGPQNIEDMYLLYIVATGKIELPTTISDIIKPKSQTVARNKYIAGPFSSKQYVKDDYYVLKRNQDFMANFVIPGIDTKEMNATTRLDETFLKSAVSNDSSVKSVYNATSIINESKESSKAYS